MPRWLFWHSNFRLLVCDCFHTVYGLHKALATSSVIRCNDILISECEATTITMIWIYLLRKRIGSAVHRKHKVIYRFFIKFLTRLSTQKRQVCLYYLTCELCYLIVYNCTPMFYLQPIKNWCRDKTPALLVKAEKYRNLV